MASIGEISNNLFIWLLHSKTPAFIYVCVYISILYYIHHYYCNLRLPLSSVSLSGSFFDQSQLLPGYIHL